ncbi:ECF transporter S component [Alkalicoccus daliensis]|uniref:Energy-coupling factor transport system substrate-specific component n=1 Tax=Alkalicoccus daliensis TaxID=745820 RepID=A0A1H0KL25_9BACI|nr:ECF transporter S component [Alkalicoccus daliensis]SDO56516.1 energy-coupling factor transport system substrate-specific component [Alkalicoccus daliensis]
MLFKEWKLKEIVLMSILGVVFAFIYLGFFLFGQTLRNFLIPFGLAPFAYEFIFGIWFIVSIIAAYIIRKRGAAFWSELIAGTVQVLVGSPAGPMLIISAAIQGLGAEAVFAATKWKNYTLPVLVAAGMSAAVFSYAWGWFNSGLAALAPGLIIATLLVRIVSGALLAGVLGKWIGDQLAKTGVLRGYALGKERQKPRERKAS